MTCRRRQTASAALPLPAAAAAQRRDHSYGKRWCPQAFIWAQQSPTSSDFLMGAESTPAGLDVPTKPHRCRQVCLMEWRPTVTAEPVNVFFYGLFMDIALLQQRGPAPHHPQVARLDSYDLDVRERATVIRNPAARVYGIVAELINEDLSTLYADPSVREYRPEAVVVTLADAHQVPAWCYTLPQVTGARRNTAYAVRLVEVAKTLAFPEDYLERLRRLAQDEPAS